MITRLIWTIWTPCPLSPKRPINLTSLSWYWLPLGTSYHALDDLDIGFSRSNFWMAESQEHGVQLARNESDMNWSNVGPIIWPWPLTCLWPWPWILKVKFSNCYISRRGCLLGMKWNGYELIRFWTHNMTLTFDHTHAFDLGFLRSNLEIAVFQDWIGPASFETFTQMYKKMHKSCKWQHGKE